MRQILLTSAALLSLGVAPAFAQTSNLAVRPGHVPGIGLSEPFSTQASNIVPADTRSDIAPSLPSPDVGPDAGPRAYLRAAADALSHDQTGKAQAALEDAETRLLDRATLPAQANEPDRAPMIRRITAARDALGRGDIARARQIVGDALAIRPATARVTPAPESTSVTTAIVGSTPAYEPAEIGPTGYGVDFVPGSTTTITPVGAPGSNEYMQPSGVLSEHGIDFLGVNRVDEAP